MAIEDEKKFTQADVDRFISDRLKRERETHGDIEALTADNVTLKAQITTLNTNLAAEQTKNTDLEGKLSVKVDSDLKLKIAKEKDINLPEKLIPFITGKTEDEIRKQMKAMVESIGPGPAVGSETNPANSATQRFTRDQVAAMKPEDVTKNWKTIEAQLADGSLVLKG